MDNKLFKWLWIRDGNIEIVSTLTNFPMIYNIYIYIYICQQHHELVEVETYLHSEGVLVRYWYPIDMLERPPQGYRKASIIGNQILDTSNIHIHRYIIKHEKILA